jgi:hypothetical protein
MDVIRVYELYLLQFILFVLSIGTIIVLYKKYTFVQEKPSYTYDQYDGIILVQPLVHPTANRRGNVRFYDHLD